MFDRLVYKGENTQGACYNGYRNFKKLFLSPNRHSSGLNAKVLKLTLKKKRKKKHFSHAIVSILIIRQKPVVGAANGVSKAFTVIRHTAKHDPHQQHWPLRSATARQAISCTQKNISVSKSFPSCRIQNGINFHFCNSFTKFDVISFYLHFQYS